VDEAISESGEVNVHAAWRMALARQAAQAYASNPKLAALTALWDYDQDEQEWSEDYRLGELDVTVSNFATSTIDRLLDQVINHADTDPVKHMRLAALQNSLPLTGAELIASWRTRAARYPERLVAAMIAEALNPGVLTGWAARDAMAGRGDDLAVRDLLSRVGHAVVRVVLALNHQYVPHRQLKWQRHLITGLKIAPGQFAERLDYLASAKITHALEAAGALLAETVELAQTRADLSSFREAMSERRRAIDPSPLGGFIFLT